MKVTEESDLVFETESGARYWIKDGRVKRLNPNDVKRADGEWVAFYDYPVLDVGYSAVLRLAPLSGYGQDDFGNLEDTTVFTTRTTTPIVGIEVRGE